MSRGLGDVYKRQESGIVINPVLENEEHYKYWLGALPFFDNVEKEGIVIG